MSALELHEPRPSSPLLQQPLDPEPPAPQPASQKAQPGLVSALSLPRRQPASPQAGATAQASSTAAPEATATSGRTSPRVRFKLEPDIAPSPSPSPPRTGSDATSATNATTTLSKMTAGGASGKMARDSFEVDDADAVDGDDEAWHRRPLLTGLEAPTVALANALGRAGTNRVSSGNNNNNNNDDDDDNIDDEEEQLRRTLSRPRSGMKAAFMNMANSIIGAGIIGQPYAFRQAGLLAGVVLLVLLTVVVDWTIRLLVINCKLSGRDSFQGAVEYCFGRKGLIAISLAQWLFAFGGMVAFGIIIGDTIPHVLGALFPGLATTPVLKILLNRRAVIVILVLGISLPLTLYRDISKLAKASTLALISMMIILFTVVVQSVLVPQADRGKVTTESLFINDGIFQAIGVISFAFVCHHNSLLIYGSLQKPTLDRFGRVTHLSTGLSMIACLMMALSGFLTFGERTLGNVLNNFPADNTMVIIARLCFGLNMLTTLPLEAFVCREVMLELWFPRHYRHFDMTLHLLFSVGLVVAAMVFSLALCDLGVVFELVGATSACALAYVLPPMCYIKLSSRSWKTVLAWITVAFGLFVMVISVCQTLLKVARGGGQKVECV